MIRNGSDDATIVVKMVGAGGRQAILGVRRSAKNVECRLNGENVSKRSGLAMALPVQWIGSQPQLLLSMGPEVRRRFLDLGVFHVEHSVYSEEAKGYQRALRQRNAAIRMNQPELVRMWDEPLATAGTAIDRLRQSFLELWAPRVRDILSEWLGGLDVSFVYRRGWNRQQDLLEIYRTKRDTDFNLGYTYAGPHRADIEIKAVQGLAEKTLSRGQQKLLVLAMNMAMLDVAKSRSSEVPVLLLDDLAAELDKGNQERVLLAVSDRCEQSFITNISSVLDPALSPSCTMFHVEHGHLTT